MLLDIERTNVQIIEMTRQAAAVRYAAGGLSVYRARLREAWHGVEAEEYSHAASELERRCEELEGELMQLRRDVFQAMEDILAELCEQMS